MNKPQTHDDTMQQLGRWGEILPPESIQRAAAISDATQAMRQDTLICPPAEQVFRALTLTQPQDTRVVIVGQDPYHTPGQANGLAFSINNDSKAQPSLVNIMTELSADVGPFKTYLPDLSGWAEQGVLLLNTCLTVEAHKPASHKDEGWQEFTGAVLKAAFGLPQPIAFVAWGGFADKLLQELGIHETQTKTIFRSSHPSPFSAHSGTAYRPAFMGSRPFSRINKFLTAAGSKPIDWLVVDPEHTKEG